MAKGSIQYGGIFKLPNLLPGGGAGRIMAKSGKLGKNIAILLNSSFQLNFEF